MDHVADCRCDECIEHSACVTCGQPISRSIGYCWPCYWNLPQRSQFATAKPNHYPCSLCEKNKRDRERYCQECGRYPSDKEIKTVLVEIRDWIS